MLEMLVNFGFKRQDAEVYIFLATSGPKNARAISLSLKTDKHRVYRSLKNLQNRRIANATPEHPSNFSVICIDKLLDLLAKSSLEEAKKIELKKDHILQLWKTSGIV